MDAEIQKKSLEYLDLIISPSLEQVGGIISDQVKYWRYKNQINILHKVSNYHKKHGISTKKIPVKTIASLMEYSSLEENENIQDMWASLLANATNNENELDDHLIFIYILKEMTFEHSVVLRYIWEMEKGVNGRKQSAINSLSILDKLQMNKKRGEWIPANDDRRLELQQLILDNLLRLNLIQYEKPYISKSPISKTRYRFRANSDVQLTTLGRKLMQECTIEDLLSH